MKADRAKKEGSIISQFQNVGEQQILQNMKANKSIIRFTHFLAHQHIAHQTIIDRAGGNATYISKIAVVEFVNALGTWVEESLLKRLHKAPFF